MHRMTTAMMAGLVMAAGAAAIAQPDRTQPQRPGTAPGQNQPPGLSRTPPGQERLTEQDVMRTISSWPQESQKAARDMIQKYGPPNGATPQMLVWRNNGPWKKTIVHAEAHEHAFPMQHRDVLLQTIGYKVPVDKFSDLAEFDGSVIAFRTGGELSAMCDDEAANFLALNLSHEIIEGRRSVQEAREFYAQQMKDFKEGRSSTYTQGLMFEPQPNAGDPDQPVQGGSGIDRGNTPSSPGSAQPGGVRPGSQPPGSTPGNPQPGQPRNPR